MVTKPPSFRSQLASKMFTSAFLSGWESIRQPDAILPCANFYGKHTIRMLREAHLNWIWVTWSVGFSHASESVQRQILREFIPKCRAAGIQVTAYISLTNMFIDDMTQNVPGSKDWMQVELDGTPRPYSAAKYDGRPTRIVACLNNPAWLEYSKKAIDGAVAAGADGIFYDNCIQGCKCRICREKFAQYTRSVCGVALPVPGAKNLSQNRSGDLRSAVSAGDQPFGRCPTRAERPVHPFGIGSK